MTLFILDGVPHASLTWQQAFFFSPLAASSAAASMCDLTHVDKSIVGLLMSSKNEAFYSGKLFEYGIGQVLQTSSRLEIGFGKSVQIVQGLGTLSGPPPLQWSRCSIVVVHQFVLAQQLTRGYRDSVVICCYINFRWAFNNVGAQMVPHDILLVENCPPMMIATGMDFFPFGLISLP